MATRTFVVRAEVSAVIEVDDQVIDMVDDKWREVFYPSLITAADIIEHIAGNILLNNVHLSNLDGWASLPDDLATVSEEDIDFISVEEKSG